MPCWKGLRINATKPLSITKIFLEEINLWKALYYGFYALSIKMIWILIIPLSVMFMVFEHIQSVWFTLLWIWPWIYLVPAISCSALLANSNPENT